MSLKAGQKAPDFCVMSTLNKKVSLSDYKGKWLVLYFYPKAFTPGCTKESCVLRDSFGDIQDLGVEILGVSLDKIDTQKDFQKKHKLPFELLSDTKKEVAKAYDVLGLLGLYTQRKTFIINPQGEIAYIFDKVHSSQHDQEILNVLKEIM